MLYTIQKQQQQNNWFVFLTPMHGMQPTHNHDKRQQSTYHSAMQATK